MGAIGKDKMGITIYNKYYVSEDFVDLFKKKEYEKFVLDLLNQSRVIFPGTYRYVEEQNSGQCDYICNETNLKYDAKLPLFPNQVEMLTDGKKHRPEIEKWILEISEEVSFNPVEFREGSKCIQSNKLYLVMKEQILKDKPDENIIFFLPYPITFSFKGSFFLQFASDFLTDVYSALCSEIDLANRSIYAIYPSEEKNTFVLRDIGDYRKEYIQSKKIEHFFSYEISGYKIEE